MRLTPSIARQEAGSLSNRSDDVDLLRSVCVTAGSRSLISEAIESLPQHGVLGPVARQCNTAIFDWLIEILSYQGVSDQVAEGYLAKHGSIGSAGIETALAASPSCPKLGGYWQFDDCGYRKTALTCSEAKHLPDCPLPLHNLRNGSLNQAAYGLFLFLRDVADGDLVGWIDERLGEGAVPPHGSRCHWVKAAVLDPMAHIHGLSFKVLSLAISNLLLATDGTKERWKLAGASAIVIDTLVHNFLHRTGILKRCDAEHAYGRRCYEPGGCADIIEQASVEIDASAFNPVYAAFFPRFVQHAIWRFCAQPGFDICNGNRIDDRYSCQRSDCMLYHQCDRLALFAAQGTD